MLGDMLRLIKRFITYVSGTVMTSGSNDTNALAYSQGTKICETPIGLMVLIRPSNGQLTFRLYQGASWITPTNGVLTGYDIGNECAFDMCYDSAGVMRIGLVFKAGGTTGGLTTNAIYTMVGSLVGTTITWGSPVVTMTTADLSYNFPDIVCQPSASGFSGLVVMSYAAGTGPSYRQFTVAAGGNVVSNGSNAALASSPGSSYPSVCLNRTTGTAHVVWSDPGPGEIRRAKLAFSSGSWSVTTASTLVIASRYVNGGQLPLQYVVCQYKNGRLYVSGYFTPGINAMYTIEVDSTDAITTRLNDGSAAMASGSLAVAENGDAYMFFTQSAILKYYKFTWATLTWSGPTTVDASTPPTDGHKAQAVNTFGGQVVCAYMVNGSAPYDIKLFALTA